MSDLYRIKPLKTLAWWILGSIVIFPQAVFVLAIVTVPSIIIISNLIPSRILYSGLSDVFIWIGVGVGGGIVGICIASWQRWLLRTKFYWAADGWYRWTIIGTSLGALIAYLIFRIADWVTVSYLRSEAMLYVLPIFLAIIAGFQAVVLRRAVKQSWLWILANFVAGVVYVGILTRNDPTNVLMTLLNMMLVLVSLGAITGIVMLFLFEAKLHPMQADDDEKVLEENTQATSVWDNAL
ncbi:MAG: hypothetical protein AAF846_09050 [Chloroflexota bacterium]